MVEEIPRRRFTPEQKAAIGREIQKQLNEQWDKFGLIEGGKADPRDLEVEPLPSGRKTGFKAAKHIARRGLVGLRKVKPSANSDTLVPKW